MSRRSPWSFLGLTLVAGLSGLLACNPSPAEAEESETPQEIGPVPVKVAKARKKTLHPHLDLVGILVADPLRSATISSRVGGHLASVDVAVGDSVEAGAPLAAIDPALAMATRDRAQATVEEARAALERLRNGPRLEEIETGAQEALRAQAALEAKRLRLDAAKALLAKNELAAVKVKELAADVAVTQAEFKKAQARLNLLRAGTRPESIHEAKARLDRALADLAAADLQVGYHSITSPLAGTVLSVGVRRGAEVARGSILAEVADLSEILAEVRVPGRAYARLTMGATATVSVIGRRDRAVTGRLVRTAGSADPANGEMIVWVAVPNEGRRLRPGLTCHVSLALDEIADCVVVPTEAVADRFGKPVISVMRDGAAHEVPVTLGLRVGADTQVLEGIGAGETVILEGGYGLPDGCPVEVLH